MLLQRTIRAAADEVGVTPGTLRLYERLGLLRPARDSTGRRIYGDREVAQGWASWRLILKPTGRRLLRPSSWPRCWLSR